MRMIGLMMFVIACGDAEQSTETTNTPAKVSPKLNQAAPKADAATADAAKPGDKPHAEMNHADHGKALQRRRFQQKLKFTLWNLPMVPL